MKKITKSMSILLVMLLAISQLAGCGSKDTPTTTPTESATSDSVSTETSTTVTETAVTPAEIIPTETFKIGYNYFGSGSYALLSLANNSKIVIDAFGNESISMDDEFSVEKIIQDVENMISSGVDGLIIWLPAPSMYLTLSDMCLKAKVPFVLNDKIPADSEIKEALLANPYFAGAVSPANSVYGDAIAEYALTNNLKTCIITSSGVGDPSDTPRLEAFKKAFLAGGGEILSELHATRSDEAQGQIEDALIANPDPDFVYGTGSDFGIAAVSALENAQNTRAVVVTSGLDKQALTLLGNSPLKMVNGDFWICGMLSAVVLQNYLDGTPLKDADGNAVWIDNVMPYEVPAEKYDLYQKFFLDESCFSPEEIRHMSGKYNPDFNYDAFLKLIADYSLDNRLIAKYKEGKVTEEELKAVGISVE